MKEVSSARTDITEISGNAGSSGLILDEAAKTLWGMYGDELDGLAIERLVVGVFFVGVKLTNGCGGVAYTPPEVIRSAGNRILKGSTPFIRGMPVAAVMAGDIPGPFAGVIRLATLNALSVPFFEDGRYTIDASGDLSGISSLFRNRRICMVGAIIPLLKKLKELGPAEVAIIDRKKETQEEAEAGYGIFVSPEHTAETLARCETAVFTGAAIANGSMEQLISFVPADAAIAVVGPTAGFVPEPLFRRNAAMVGTVVVTDIDQALEVLGEGGGGYRLFGTCMRKINLLNVKRLRQLGLEMAF
ncbi:MAG: hypothetical protein EHM79_03525 [Geobacter sp.]|nr:MAG: hypothetical protein EHM79_03525 [Geobacter sp.]